MRTKAFTTPVVLSLSMPWEALQQNSASLCGFQRCKDGYSFCYDQRCRACSDLQGTEFGCQNPHTMAKCYRFCLDEMQRTFSTREEIVNRTWQDKLNNTLDLHFTTEDNSTLSFGQSANSSDAIFQHNNDILMVLFVLTSLLTTFLIFSVIYWTYKACKKSHKSCRERQDDLDKLENVLLESKGEIKTSVSSQTEGLPLDETSPSYSRGYESATAPSLDTEETNLLKGVPVQGCMDHGSLSQGQEYGTGNGFTENSQLLTNPSSS